MIEKWGWRCLQLLHPTFLLGQPGKIPDALPGESHPICACQWCRDRPGHQSVHLGDQDGHAPSREIAFGGKIGKDRNEDAGPKWRELKLIFDSFPAQKFAKTAD